MVHHQRFCACSLSRVQEREADLRLFVEVATQSCLLAGREGQELAQVRAAEAKLKEQVRAGWGRGLGRE